MPRFPKSVYIQMFKAIEDNNVHYYPITSLKKEDTLDEDLGYAEAGVRVGVYELKEIISLKKTITITEEKIKE